MKQIIHQLIMGESLDKLIFFNVQYDKFWANKTVLQIRIVQKNFEYLIPYSQDSLCRIIFKSKRFLITKNKINHTSIFEMIIGWRAYITRKIMDLFLQKSWYVFIY